MHQEVQKVQRKAKAKKVAVAVEQGPALVEEQQQNDAHLEEGVLAVPVRVERAVEELLLQLQALNLLLLLKSSCLLCHKNPATMLPLLTAPVRAALGVGHGPLPPAAAHGALPRRPVWLAVRLARCSQTCLKRH